MSNKCNEIIFKWDGSGQQFVCEAQYGTEHTHADLMSYMRPLTVEEGNYVTEHDDCLILETPGEV